MWRPYKWTRHQMKNGECVTCHKSFPRKRGELIVGSDGSIWGGPIEQAGKVEECSSR